MVYRWRAQRPLVCTWTWPISRVSPRFTWLLSTVTWPWWNSSYREEGIRTPGRWRMRARRCTWPVRTTDSTRTRYRISRTGARGSANSERGCQPIIWHFSPAKCLKMKKNLVETGDVPMWCPHLDPPMTATQFSFRDNVNVFQPICTPNIRTSLLTSYPCPIAHRLEELMLVPVSFADLTWWAACAMFIMCAECVRVWLKHSPQVSIRESDPNLTCLDKNKLANLPFIYCPFGQINWKSTCSETKVTRHGRAHECWYPLCISHVFTYGWFWCRLWSTWLNTDVKSTVRTRPETRRCTTAVWTETTPPPTYCWRFVITC